MAEISRSRNNQQPFPSDPFETDFSASREKPRFLSPYCYSSCQVKAPRLPPGPASLWQVLLRQWAQFPSLPYPSLFGEPTPFSQRSSSFVPYSPPVLSVLDAELPLKSTRRVLLRKKKCFWRGRRGAWCPSSFPFNSDCWSKLWRTAVLKRADAKDGKSVSS